MVVSEAHERREIAARIPVGTYQPITHDAVWQHVGKNLGRDSTKGLAQHFLNRCTDLRRGTVSQFAAGLEQAEARERQGLERHTIRARMEQSDAERHPVMARVFDRARDLADQAQRLARQLMKRGQQRDIGRDRPEHPRERAPSRGMGLEL